MFLFEISPILLFFHLSGLPPQHATLAPATAYYTTSSSGGGGGGGGGSGNSSSAADAVSQGSPKSYHQENGHDTFSDFVTLVCQEAQGGGGGNAQQQQQHQAQQQQQQQQHQSRSPGNNNSSKSVPGGAYNFSSAMYPPPPPAPMARPVAIIRSSGKGQSRRSQTLLS